MTTSFLKKVIKVAYSSKNQGWLFIEEATN